MALSAELRAMIGKAKNKYQNSNNKVIKPKEGSNTYRILVPQADWVAKNGGQWWIDVGVHWIKAGKNDKPLAVVGDSSVTFNEPSRLNNAIERAIATAPDSTSKELYESWRSRKTIWLNVIDRSNNNEVEILELTKGTFAQVLQVIEMYDESDQDITDPANGVDIVINRIGKDIDTKYTVMAKPGVSQPVTPDQMNKCHNLIDAVKQQYFDKSENEAILAVTNLSGIALSSSDSDVLAISDNTKNLLKSTSAVVGDATVSAEEDPELKAMQANAVSNNTTQSNHSSAKPNEDVEIVAEIEDDNELTSVETDEILAELNDLIS